MNTNKKYDFGWDPVEISPLQVEVGNSFEEAVRKFKVLFQKERIVALVKEKMAYEKPSVKKRRKQREARSRKMMTEARERMIQNGEWEKVQRAKQKKRQKNTERRIKKINEDAND